MSTVETQLRKIPALGWVALAVLGGVLALAWFEFGRAPEDVNWGDPQQPPTNVELPGSRLPGDHGPAFRSRNWPGTLMDSPGSIVKGDRHV